MSLSEALARAGITRRARPLLMPKAHGTSPAMYLPGLAPGPKSHNARVTTSSKAMSWRTPAHFVDLVERAGGSRVMLDPCADRDRKHHFAARNYTEREDGLACPWRNVGLVYVNPPYGRQLIHWIAKACNEARAMSKTDQIILIAPARTDTKWFQDALLTVADVLCFWRGRLTFENNDGNRNPATFPTVAAYYGKRTDAFIDVFERYGWIHRERTRGP